MRRLCLRLCWGCKLLKLESVLFDERRAFLLDDESKISVVHFSMRTLNVMGLVIGAALLATPNAHAQMAGARPILKFVGAIALPGVEGRMDHLAFDAARGRLFVSALENHSLEVVDVKRRRRIGSIGGINEPQGVLFLPRYNRVFVGSRGDGTLRSFDGRTFAEGAWADLGRNADNVRFDGASRTIYVASNGEPGKGAFDALDLLALLPPSLGGKPFEPRSPADFRFDTPRRADARITLALGEQPEGFQLDPAHHRAFVNIPDEHVVAVVDTRTMKIIARWPVPFKRNFPLAFSASRDRVFVVTRNSPHLLVYRASDGRLLSQQPCAGDGDETFYDGATGRLYVIGGEGKINVFDARFDRPRLLQTVSTVPRARTGAFLPTMGLLAVAVPHTKKQRAEIRLFHISK